MATAIQFRKAVKFEAKGRVALVGPAGSGKSFTMLTLARLLAGPEGKIAAIDTEHGSLSKYADLFDFDVIEMESYSPDNFLASLTAAEQAGYAVFCCDSLSHFWMGKDGALEFVDLAGKRYKDNMGGWKEFRPHEREMVDRMIASPLHIITTMRTKTDYQEVTDDKGKKKRIKVGLAPVQRDGLEYEFDLVGYMDDENTLIFDKSRCPELAGRAVCKPSAKDLEVFRDWLKGATRPKPEVIDDTIQISGSIEKEQQSPKGWWFDLSGGVSLFAPSDADCELILHKLGREITVKAREAKTKQGRPYYVLINVISDGYQPTETTSTAPVVEAEKDELPF